MDGRLERMREFWEWISPHPKIAAHPILTVAALTALTIYWSIGNPVADFLSTLKAGISITEAVWNYIIPTAAQSLFTSYPALRLFAVIAIFGLLLRTYDKGLEHIVSEDIGPVIASLLEVLVKIPAVILGGLATAISENRGFISDVLSGLISSFLFKLLVAAGLIGAAFTYFGL